MPESSGRRLDALCIGSPLMDQLGFASLETVERLGLNPGTMTLVDVATTERIASEVPPDREVSGGTVANTAVGIVSLGGRCAFVGAIGSDALGDRYRADLEAAGVHPILERIPSTDSPDLGTGRCFVIVTPDAERTMATALGASVLLDHDAPSFGLIADATVVYFDGYLLDFPDGERVAERIVEIARTSGTAVAFGLADPGVVERHREVVIGLVKSGVDLLFGNEHEVRELSGTGSFTDGLLALRRPGLVAVATRGAHGASVVTEHGEIEVPAVAVPEIVDVTGAGDLFCAGVLFGYARGRDLLVCAELGALAASEVISHLGARPEHSLAELAAKTSLG